MHPRDGIVLSLLPVVKRMVGGRKSEVYGYEPEDAVQEVLLRVLVRHEAGYFDQAPRVSRFAQGVDLARREVRHVLDARSRRDALRRRPDRFDPEWALGEPPQGDTPEVDVGWLAELPPTQALYARALVAPRTLEAAHLVSARSRGLREPATVLADARAGRFDPLPDATWMEHVARVVEALFEAPCDGAREAVRKTLGEALRRLEARSANVPAADASRQVS